MKTYGERIELVKKMLGQNKSFRDIMKRTKFSPNKISEIKKDLFGIEAERQHTQAYRLFHDGKGVFEVALELGLTQEQSEKYYTEYLKMTKKDNLLYLFNNEEKLGKLMNLQQCLTDENIPEEEYQSMISKIKYKDPPEWQKAMLETQVRTLKYEIAVLKTDQAKRQMEISIMSRGYAEKSQIVQSLTSEAEALQSKNIQFRRLIEEAIKGELGPLVDAVHDERFSFVKAMLCAFLEYYFEAVLDTLQYDPDMKCRLSGQNYFPEDRRWFCDRLSSVGQYYIEDWLKDPTKWQNLNKEQVPLRI
jgi:hypothetical protein